MGQLEVINEQEEVIEVVSRELIHQKGLLHRESHVWFYTPDGQIILQHRAKDKDTWPDLLDIAVGGHVEVGDTYLEAALKEMHEETGLTVSPNELTELGVVAAKFEDTLTHTINNVHDCRYLFCFNGSLEDLEVEKEKALGFEQWPADYLLNLSPQSTSRFTDHITNDHGKAVIEQIIQRTS